VILLILLMIALVLLGVFAAQNGSTEQVNLLTLHWSGVPQWLPPVVAGGGVAVLLTLYMLYAGGRHGVRQRGLKGRIGKHESRISELQTENERLRQEVAELRTRGPIAPGDRTV
jgi:uncharacterized integral membrane protein